jgi:uncharacterized protein YcfJ
MRTQLSLRQAAAVAVLLVTSIVMSGCASSGVNTKRGVVLGTLIGAGAGAAIGHQTRSSGPGAIIGAGVGAALGGLTGNAMDEKADQDADRYR